MVNKGSEEVKPSRDLKLGLEDRIRALREYIKDGDTRMSTYPSGTNPYREITSALLDEMMITRNSIQMGFDRDKKDLKKFYEASFALKGYIDAVTKASEGNEMLVEQEFASKKEVDLGTDPSERGNKAIEYAREIRDIVFPQRRNLLAKAYAKIKHKINSIKRSRAYEQEGYEVIYHGPIGEDS